VNETSGKGGARPICGPKSIPTCTKELFFGTFIYFNVWG